MYVNKKVKTEIDMLFNYLRTSSHNIAFKQFLQHQLIPTSDYQVYPNGDHFIAFVGTFVSFILISLAIMIFVRLIKKCRIHFKNTAVFTTYHIVKTAV